MAYVEGGCKGLPPAGTAADDAVGTYVTNYVIAFVGFMAALQMCCNPRAGSMFKILATNFFIWTAVGYCGAGLLHHLFHEDEDNPFHETWWKVSFGATLLGILAVNFMANSVLCSSVPRMAFCQPCLSIIALITFAGMMIFLVFGDVFDALVPIGIYSCAVMLFVLVVLLVSVEGLPGRVACLGILFIIVGYSVQPILSPLCGAAAYSSCFKNCPLPAPRFNHNALFHVLFAVGLSMLGTSLNTDPLETKEMETFTLLMPPSIDEDVPAGRRGGMCCACRK
jgi:xanthosine utilization system XapX-like protein